MYLNATSFIRNRKSVISMTYRRVVHITEYLIDCYSIMLTDKPKFSLSFVKSNTNYHFEDYLKMEFVEKYLKLHKAKLTSKISELDEITFHYETVKGFTDVNDNIQKSDKIDVYVNKLGLKKEWAVEDEDLYFAVECKRIKILSDTASYVGDIQDFCDREYKNLRIPFEGQIAFIENASLTHKEVSDAINANLKATSAINTTDFLSMINMRHSFNGSYKSIHTRNHGNKDSFTILHLLFDYSQLVIA